MSRKKTDQPRISDTKQRFEGIVDTSPVVAFLKDRTGRRVYASQTREGKFPVMLSDFQGKTVLDFSSPEMANKGTGDLQVLSMGRVTGLIETLSTADGNQHWMVFKFPFTKNDGHRLLGGVAVDITHRMEAEESGRERLAELLQAEEKLRASEQRYRHLVESSLGLMCTHDLNGRLLSINPAAAKSLGYETEDMIGKDLRQFLVPRARKGFDLYRKRVRQSGADSGLMILWTSDGQERVWKYHNTICSAPPGKRAYVLGHAQDVTELKRAEDEAKALSLTDELTGLYNQRGFFTLAEQHLKLARRGPTKDKGLLLVYADLDGLKRINDHFGHKEGSLAIVRTGEILKGAFRESDIVARLGGDEFAVLTIDASEESGELMRTRLKQRFDEYNAQGIFPYKLNLSVGTSPIKGGSSISLQEVLIQADQSMYRDKVRKRTRRQKSQKPALPKNSSGNSKD